MTIAGIAKERCDWNVNRLSLKRRNTAVGRPLVMKMLEGNLHSSRWTDCECCGRADSVTIEIHKLTETTRVLIESINTKRDRVAQLLIHVCVKRLTPNEPPWTETSLDDVK